MDLQKRKVSIHSLTITSVDLPDVTMKVTCSRGTYVRSLAADLGRELGPGAHLKSLMRLCSGPFSVKDALSLEGLAHLSRDHLFQEMVIPLQEALPDMKEAEVDDRMAQRIRNGHQPGWEEMGVITDSPRPIEGYLKLVAGGDLVAIAKAHHPFEEKGSSPKRTIHLRRRDR
jgi:tRNA pseudouridine55 synthase